MMTTMMSFMVVLTGIMSTQSSNPVKLSIYLLGLSGLVFGKMYIESSSTWFPMLYFLIFMGGILIMFMILSSVLPNEKSHKTKFFFVLVTAVSLIWLTLPNSPNPTMNTALEVTLSMNSSNTMLGLVVMMIVYFFCSMKFVSMEKEPMRSHTCCMWSLIL